VARADPPPLLHHRVPANPLLYRFKSEEEAIKMVNDSNSAPPVYSYSPDLGPIWRVAEFGGQRQTSQDPARTRSWWTDAKLTNFALTANRLAMTTSPHLAACSSQESIAKTTPDNASFVRYMGCSAAPFREKSINNHEVAG